MSHHYAVMGNPIDHSLSPIIHQMFARQTGLMLTYEKILVASADFKQQVNQFFAQGGLGLNITQPCKEAAFNLADHATPRCLRAKAANTLWQESGKLWADNTDGIGLIRDLAHYINLADKRILVLGAGGAVRGILAPLIACEPAQLIVSNRTLEKAAGLCIDFSSIIVKDLAELSGTFDLIINATSASISKQSLMLPSSLITPSTVCYDLAYRYNTSTPFVTWATSNGGIGIDGLGMLVEQAAESFSIWHGVRPDVCMVLKQLRT